MASTRTELDKMSSPDLYSMMMFALFKLTEDARYRTISQLSYILDKDSMLKLCQFYGGMTLKVPTIKELDNVLNAIFLFQAVDLEKKDYNEVLNSFDARLVDKRSIEECYHVVKELLNNYNFSSGRDDV